MTSTVKKNREVLFSAKDFDFDSLSEKEIKVVRGLFLAKMEEIGFLAIALKGLQGADKGSDLLRRMLTEGIMHTDVIDAWVKNQVKINGEIHIEKGHDKNEVNEATKGLLKVGIMAGAIILDDITRGEE